MKRTTALFLSLMLLLTLPGCREQELASPGAFYYYRADTAYTGSDGVLAPEQRELRGIEEDLDAILELYCAGPQSRELENPLPQNTAAPAWALHGDTLTLAFGPDFAALSGIELTVAAGCLARTFLPLTDTHTLILTADGALLNGDTAMILTLDDLGLRDNSQDRLHGDFTVYYADAGRRYLIAQSVSMDLSAREELPALLLERMLTAPSGSGLRSALPAGCRILSVRAADGICSVDLSNAFENRRYYSHTGQLLSLMGIVNTLTALPEIDQVELSVEGDLLVRYGALSIPGPMSFDDRFLGPVRTGLGERDSTIYLAHGEETGLVPLPTRLRQTGALSQAELLVRELLSDSGINGLTSCIPALTQLNSLHIEGQICHVDLSQEYLTAPDQLLWAGRVITATLCTLETISAVSITVEGVIPEHFDSSLFSVLTPQNDWFL